MMYRMCGGIITACCMGGLGTTNVVELNVHPNTAPSPDIISVPVLRHQEEKKADIIILPGTMEERLTTAFPPPIKCSLVGASASDVLGKLNLSCPRIIRGSSPSLKQNNQGLEKNYNRPR